MQYAIASQNELLLASLLGKGVLKRETWASWVAKPVPVGISRETLLPFLLSLACASEILIIFLLWEAPETGRACML